MEPKPDDRGGYLLWIGNLLDLKAFELGVKASPAGVRLQSGLAEPLLDRGIPIHCVTRLSDDYWPKGPLFSGRVRPCFFRGVDGEFASFLNLPKIRRPLVRRAFLKAFDRLRRRQGPPKLALFYNIEPQNYALFQLVKHSLGIPSFVLAADKLPHDSPNAGIYQQACDEADGVVFLSWSDYQTSNVSKKIQIEGGISKAILEKRMSHPPTPEPYMLYTGAFDPYCGVELLLDAFERASLADDVRLVICGNCRDAQLLRRFQSNPRVDYRGFIPPTDPQLEETCARAAAFVNCYLPSAPECQGKFPSKLFEYLSYGRPVISTRTSGIPPEYDGALRFVEGENPDSFARVLEETMRFDSRNHAEQLEANRAFLSDKTWDRQGARLIEFFKQNAPGAMAELLK